MILGPLLLLLLLLFMMINIIIIHDNLLNDVSDLTIQIFLELLILVTCNTEKCRKV